MQIYTFVEPKFRPDTTSSSRHILTLEVMKVASETWQRCQLPALIYNPEIEKLPLEFKAY